MHAEQLDHLPHGREIRDIRHRHGQVFGTIDADHSHDTLQRGQPRGVQPWHRLGPAEQESLNVVDAQFQRQGALLGVLDTLGDDATTDGAGHVDHGTQDFGAHRVVLDPRHEIAINLDVIGPHQ